MAMASNVVYYFAYGPNMNPEKMNICQITYTDRRLGQLNGFEFVMNQKRMNGTGGANIRHKENSSVYGVLYTCDFDSLHKLDRYEGNIYTRQLVKIIIAKDNFVDAHAYIGLENPSNENLHNYISKEYLEHMLCGSDLLPQDYLEFLKSFYEYAVTICPGEDYFLTEAANETEE